MYALYLRHQHLHGGYSTPAQVIRWADCASGGLEHTCVHTAISFFFFFSFLVIEYAQVSMPSPRLYLSLPS